LTGRVNSGLSGSGNCRTSIPFASGRGWHDMSDYATAGEVYEEAIRRLEPYIKRAEDGTFILLITDARALGIDPVVFADLKRSLDETNRRIGLGEIKASDIK
jgi:hypothetical protein